MVRSRCDGSRGFAVLIRATAGDVNGLYGDQPTTSGSSKPVNDGTGEIITLGSIGF